MKKYSMTCTCGDKLSVDANSQEEAVKKLQDMMTEEAIAKHFAEKHPGQTVPTKEQEDEMLMQTVKEDMSPPAAPAM